MGKGRKVMTRDSRELRKNVLEGKVDKSLRRRVKEEVEEEV